MKRTVLILLSLLALCVHAQTVTRQYHNVSMAQALRELNPHCFITLLLSNEEAYLYSTAALYPPRIPELAKYPSMA